MGVGTAGRALDRLATQNPASTSPEAWRMHATRAHSRMKRGAGGGGEGLGGGGEGLGGGGEGRGGGGGEGSGASVSFSWKRGLPAAEKGATEKK